jgi:hypothetical protein
MQIAGKTRRQAMVAAGRLAILAGLTLALASTAFAALGGDEASVQNDGQQMKASKLSMKSAQKYTVHEIQADSGTTVKEFVSPGGTVFAVTWQGPRIPDLHQLLGDYYEQFRQSAAQRRLGPTRYRGPLVIQRSGLVVESGGHMGAFSGKAYLPDLLPEGVQPGDIQ